MNIQEYTSDQWFKIAEIMHLNVFDEHRSADMNRIDYALVVWEDDKPMGYVTCKEYDSHSVYIGYGGAMPYQRGKFNSMQGYKMILDYLKSKYSRVNTLIENTNIVMLKMAFACGFIVTGLRYFNGSVLLENSIEWSK